MVKEVDDYPQSDKPLSVLANVVKDPGLDHCLSEAYQRYVGNNHHCAHKHKTPVYEPESDEQELKCHFHSRYDPLMQPLNYAASKVDPIVDTNLISGFRSALQLFHSPF